MTNSDFAFRVYDEIYKDFADSREYFLDKDGCLVGVNGVLARKTLVAVPLDTLCKAESYLRGLGNGEYQNKAGLYLADRLREVIHNG